jgi:hypothetical protein
MWRNKMDLKELKKLINEEVNRKKSLEEQDKTNPGFKGRESRKSSLQASPKSGILDPDTGETLSLPIETPEEMGYVQMFKDKPPQELEAERQKLIKQIFSNIDDETLYKILPLLPDDLKDDFGKLTFITSKIKGVKTPVDTSRLPDKPGGFGLPTKTSIERNPNLKTKISPDASTKPKQPIPVRPISPNEPTQTGVIDKIKNKLGFKE